MQRIKWIFLCFLMIFTGLPFMAAHARTEGIAAVVNQDAISMKDLNDRMHLVIVSSGLPPTEEIKEKLLKQVLDDLIEEQLKIQEARRNEITVTDQEVAQGFAALAQQNNLTPQQFESIMKHDGINPATIERQVRAQIGWSKVIQEVMRPRVTVTDTDIDDYLERLRSLKGKSEYRLAEIFLPVGEGKPDADALQLAQRLVAEIRAGKAPFSKVAQQFSGAAGAARGGDLGWIQQGQLDPKLEQVASAMQKNEISNPVRLNDGYHILYLRDIRTITDESIPPREEIYSMIGIQRLERLANRTLLDLRTTAFIENRVQS